MFEQLVEQLADVADRNGMWCKDAARWPDLFDGDWNPDDITPGLINHAETLNRERFNELKERYLTPNKAKGRLGHDTSSRPTEEPQTEKRRRTMAAIEIERGQAVELFEKLGFKTADKWSAKQLTTKVCQLNDMEEVTDDTDLENDQLNLLLDNILDAIEDKSNIKVTGFEVNKEGVKNKRDPQKRGKGNKGKGKTAKKKTSTNGAAAKKPTEKKTKKPTEKKTAKPPTGKKPGILASMIEFLNSASEEKPLTREQVLKKLTVRFKDRNVDGMGVTVKSQLPLRLRSVKDLDVREKTLKNGKTAYWIPSN